MKTQKNETVLRGREALKDLCLSLGIILGKTKQTHSLLTNPRSKQYNKTIAARRLKEKNRRRVNALSY